MFTGAYLIGFKIVAGAVVQTFISAAQSYFIGVFSGSIVYMVIAVNEPFANIGNFKISFTAFRFIFSKNV